MNKALLDIIVCPECKGKLRYEAEQSELICLFDSLAYPIRDDIPVMLKQEARMVPLDEAERYRK